MPAGTTLFAYGSLMFPEVWLHVVGRERRSCPGRLRGHTAYTVRGYSFPGLVPGRRESVTPGRLYFDLDADDWSRLDAFEDSFYERLPVRVEPADLGAPVEASAYIVAPAQRGVLSDTIWTAEWFAEHALGDFLDRICGFDAAP